MTAAVMSDHPIATNANGLPPSSSSSSSAADEPSGFDFQKPLSSAQERRLIGYLDEKLLDIQRHYNKRYYDDASSLVPTMSAYIEAMEPLLTLALLIRPLNSAAAHLRTSLLLRLTGDFLDCIPGYNEPDDFNSLLDALDDLDRGWLAVLRSQAWNPDSRRGVYCNLNADGQETTTEERPRGGRTLSGTETTRLRSLLLTGTDKLEEWLEDIVALVGEPSSTTEAFELAELRRRFDGFFQETLMEMGAFGGVSPQEFELTYEQ